MAYLLDNYIAVTNPLVTLVVPRFAHESVGEDDDRHLVLQRCPETAMYVAKYAHGFPSFHVSFFNLLILVSAVLY
jgi:hypothetical protein